MSKGILIAFVALNVTTAAAAGAAEAKPVKSLAECIAIALENHPTLGAAAASVQAGQQRVRQATSAYLPQFSATYGANRRYTSASARTGTNVGTQSQTFNFYNSGFGFTQLLFDFGQNLDSIRAAQAGEESLQADATTQRETVVLNVKQSYFNVCSPRGGCWRVADETVRQNQQHLDQAQGRFDVGLAAKFDVTQAKVQLANAELDHRHRPQQRRRGARHAAQRARPQHAPRLRHRRQPRSSRGADRRGGGARRRLRQAAGAAEHARAGARGFGADRGAAEGLPSQRDRQRRVRLGREQTTRSGELEHRRST